MPRGLGSEECQHSSRPPPDPRYGGRFPGSRSANPARVVQLIVCASAPLPLAGFWKKAMLAGRKSAPGASSRRGWSGRADGDIRPYSHTATFP